MKLQVVHFGRITQAGYIPTASDYIKRLNSFCKSEDIELKLDVQGRDKRSSTLREDAIYKKQDGEYVVALDERGKSYNSVQLSDRIQLRIDDPRIKKLTFLIGPPYGFDEASKTACDELWSLSSLTIPSDMAWLMVWEQLYRAFTIMKGLPYHHD
jgi:23S rRNA (pseudouridine1915-N3)-methyltransferase